MVTVKKKPEPDIVMVKLSCCQNCQGAVRVAVTHCMTTISKNSFMKEVMEFNLSVKEITLEEYRNGTKWCECKS